MGTSTSTENTEKIDKIFDIDMSKYKHSHMEAYTTTYKLYTL